MASAEHKATSGLTSPCAPVAVSRQILRDTGVFEHTWRELELWLEHLDNTAEERKESVIQFLERVSYICTCGRGQVWGESPQAGSNMVMAVPGGVHASGLCLDSC